MAEIVKRLDKVHVDVLEKDDGTLEFQGAILEYEQKLMDGEKLIQLLAPEMVGVKPEEATRILGETAGAHVAALARTEDMLQEERDTSKTRAEALSAEVKTQTDRAEAAEALAVGLANRLASANQALKQLVTATELPQPDAG